MALQAQTSPLTRQQSEDNFRTSPRSSLRRRGRRSLLLGSVIALAAFAVPVGTWAQAGKATPKAGAKADERYGDQGGEVVLPANTKSPSTVMRARNEDSFLKLSNPRLGEAGGPKGKATKALLVDYEVVARGKLDGGFIVLRADDGSKAEVVPPIGSG